MIINPPWEPLKNEPKIQYSAFLAYCDLGPTRSLKQLPALVAHPLSHISQWSKTYGWVKRSLAYDKYQSDLVRQKLETEMKEMANRHTSLALEMLNKAEKTIAETDLSNAANLVKWIVEAMKIERMYRDIVYHHVLKQYEDEGETSESQKTESSLMELTDDELAQLAQIADRLAENGDSEE